MYDPRYRLHRVVLGDSVLAPRSSADRLKRPEMIRPRLVSVPDRQPQRKWKSRTTRRIASAETNAPKLIRLIRTPYRLDRGSPKRVDDGLKREPRDESRPPHGKDVRATMGENRRSSWPRATRDGPTLPIRPRGSLDSWLASSNADPEKA